MIIEARKIIYNNYNNQRIKYYENNTNTIDVKDEIDIVYQITRALNFL